jgi:hypothetical protein
MSEDEFEEESFNTELPWLRIAVVIAVVIGVIVAVGIITTSVTSLVDDEYIPPEVEEAETGLTMEQRDCINLNVIRHYQRILPLTQDECDDIYIKLHEAGFVPEHDLQPTPE